MEENLLVQGHLSTWARAQKGKYWPWQCHLPWSWYKINENCTFSLKLYDKRDAFPYLSSNIPSRIFYASVSGEILRIARCASEITEFKISCKTLINRVKKQGAKPKLLTRTLNKTFNNHINEFSPFFNSVVEFRQGVM